MAQDEDTVHKRERWEHLSMSYQHLKTSHVYAFSHAVAVCIWAETTQFLLHCAGPSLQMQYRDECTIAKRQTNTDADKESI